MRFFYLSFFMLRDGSKLVKLLVRALPLGDEREHLLFAKFAEVARATVKGNLVVAVVQGTLGGIIFAILGISGALLWGVVMTSWFFRQRNERKVSFSHATHDLLRPRQGKRSLGIEDSGAGLGG
ncbi:hypothetical protein GSUB_06945 [Geoalkalibacter subterraneus]|uniref:Uncharacterized protein n=1 Tax=Geoalkalibacter subterraneus TaxID=483547 RepID=A0A0B5FRX4_9BACT|nr:AI-2E family transporter [Geoalkalibacter subterraneus]AJF06336.1 hypothetical protein GSUB_06945 [Geoalkalibacter subterraneus]